MTHDISTSCAADSRYFRPGERITLRPEWRRHALPLCEAVHVFAPGRLHFGVLDFSKMAPGLGGGGLGISTTTAIHSVRIVRDEGHAGCNIATGAHLLELFRRCVGYEAADIGIFLERSSGQTHAGFGSNVAFNTAVLSGINALFGCPFALHELWDMITQNYVENTDDGAQLYFGLDTGVGEACLLYGGLVWIDGRNGTSRLAALVPSEELWVVTGAGNRATLAGEILRRGGNELTLGDRTEAELVTTHFMECERKYGAAFKSFMSARMCPALLRGSMAEVLSLGWELNTVSNTRVLEGIYRGEVLRDLNRFTRDEGALYAGMSSAGPGYFAFAADLESASRLRDALERRFDAYFSQWDIGRAGTKLVTQVHSLSSAEYPLMRH